SFAFSFTDTSPTVIYPLSLHDALPISLGTPAAADVITDWNEKVIAFVTKHRMLPPQAERVIACVHVAMFDAVNSIEGRYRPYRVDRKSTRLNSSHLVISYAVFCLKKKK